MILKIIKYLVVFLLGALTMAANEDLYEKARVVFDKVDQTAINVLGKESKKGK
jgi:hypothetical protein